MRNPEHAGRKPITSSLNQRGCIDAHVSAPDAPAPKINYWRRILLPLAVAVAVIAIAFIATRPAGALDCVVSPCDAVGDPPPAMPMPPLGGCVPGAIAMCPRSALPLVMQ